LCVDGAFFASLPLGGQERFCFQDLPARDKLLELWLPPSGEFRLRGIELDQGASLAPHEDSLPRWVTYGSSITHCRGAERPTQTWPAIVARARGFHLTCLGYGSHCQLDMSVARMMRDLPADYLSMKAGINIYGLNSLNWRTFPPAVIGFIQTVRDGHADAPFAVISPIVSRPREETPNLAGMTLRQMREETAAAVAALRAHGDRNLHYVDGLRLMGPEQADLMPGDTHPDAAGYKVMGQRFIRYVADELFM
jgi:hypothetical protein